MKKVDSKTNINSYIKIMKKDINYPFKYNNNNNNNQINININNDNNNNKNNTQNVIVGSRPNILSLDNIMARNAIVGSRPNILSIDKINEKKKLLNYNINEKIINLDNIRSINYKNYFESNILKLLSYLKQFDITDIKIVAHSALMKKFLNQKILGVTLLGKRFQGKKIKSELKTIEKKENMWSIILNSGEIVITRHAFTIANLYKEEAERIKGFIKTTAIKYNQFSDEDTKLSLYGILGALDFNNDAINLNNECNTVFVSILVRTWITAICLYLPKIEFKKIFTLVVSPFIKEATKVIGKIGLNTDDNLPIPINKQIIIIKNFLKFLREKIRSNKEGVQPQYIKSCIYITKFFDNDGVLEIYGVKKLKDKKFKYVKYQISYDKSSQYYISTNKKENYFESSRVSRKEQEITPRCIGFGCVGNSEKLAIKKLQILPGVRKPISKLNIDIEPLSKNKVDKFLNFTQPIEIGIIDIDEEGKIFTLAEIKKFYTTNYDWFKDKNIIVVCTQNSVSRGTEHFQHLLKIVLEDETNTNFNFKNRNKINISKYLSLSSKSLRTRVYTQHLDNDKLEVDFKIMDFKNIQKNQGNEGGILCSIKYDEKDLISILNLYTDVKNTESINNNNDNTIKKNKIIEELLKLSEGRNIYPTGKADLVYEINTNSFINTSSIKTTGGMLKK
jgi:hypothetical protein